MLLLLVRDTTVDRRIGAITVGEGYNSGQTYWCYYGW